MNEETLRVLKMVEEGKVKAEKAVELLEAMNINTSAIQAAKYEERLLKVQASSAGGDKVTVNLPVEVVSDILSSTNKLPIKLNGIEDIDIKEVTFSIAKAIQHKLIGEIVCVESAGGDYVRVVVE